MWGGDYRASFVVVCGKQFPILNLHSQQLLWLMRIACSLVSLAVDGEIAFVECSQSDMIPHVLRQYTSCLPHTREHSLLRALWFPRLSNAYSDVVHICG